MRGVILALLLGVTRALAVDPVIETTHPKMFLETATPAYLAELRARCGVTDGDNQTVYASEWNMYGTIFNTYKTQITGFGTPPSTPGYSQSIINNLGTQASKIAWVGLMYSHNPGLLDPYLIKVRQWMDAVSTAADAKVGSIGDGLYGSFSDKNSFGEYGAYYGWCVLYDWTYQFMKASGDVPRLQAYWQALYATHNDAYTYADGSGWSGADVPAEDWNFYKGRYWLDPAVAVEMCISGDPEGTAPEQALLTSRWPRIWIWKQQQFAIPELLLCGTHSGYIDNAPSLEMIIGHLFRTCTNNDVTATLAPTYYNNYADWLMRAVGGLYTPTDQTGQSAWLPSSSTGQKIHGRFQGLSNFFEARQADPYTLYFLDALQSFTAIEVQPMQIILDDKRVARSVPTSSAVPLCRMYGDLTPNDGGQSECAYMRNSWAYSDTTISISILGGQLSYGHDRLVDGHFAIFRGKDNLTHHSGAYDGTDYTHTQGYGNEPISYNTILIIDPANPYSNGAAEFDRFREGMESVGTPEGTNLLYAADCFQPQNQGGYYKRFTNSGGAQYILYDVTYQYPNTQRSSLWDLGTILTSATRSFFLVGGHYYLIFDRVRGVSTATTVAPIIHWPDQVGPILTSGSWTLGTPAYTGAGNGTPGAGTAAHQYRVQKDASRIFATIVEPANAELWRVGGSNSTGVRNRGWRRRPTGTCQCCDGATIDNPDPSFEFWLPRFMSGAGRNMEVDPCNIGSAGEQNDYFLIRNNACSWRTEARTTGTANRLISQCLEITAVSQAAPAATVAALSTPTDADRAGIVVSTLGNQWVTVVSRDETIDATVIYTAQGTTPAEHAVADLFAGDYSVLQDGRRINGRHHVTDEGGLLTFQCVGGGTFQIERMTDVVQEVAR